MSFYLNSIGSSPELAAKYAALKTQLAATHPKDREAYTDAKAEFVGAIVREA